MNCFLTIASGPSLHLSSQKRRSVVVFLTLDNIAHFEHFHLQYNACQAYLNVSHENYLRLFIAH